MASPADAARTGAARPAGNGPSASPGAEEFALPVSPGPAARGGPAVAPEQERYGRFDAEIVPLGGADARALRQDGSLSRVLSSAEVRALNACVTPRSLAAHAAECVRILPPAVVRALAESGGPREAEAADRQAVEAALRGLAAEGLLAAETEVTAWLDTRLAAAAQGGAPPAIGALCIPTRDRPDTLARGLASWLANGAAHGRTTEVVLLDDSASPEVQARNAEVLRDLAARHRRPAFLATRARRARYARALAGEAGVPEAAARFALLGDPAFATTYGATRNALLLDSVGELCLQVDDDTLGTVCRPPGAREELVLTPEMDPNEYWFTADFDGALATVEVTGEDFLAVHERMLGRTPAECAVSGPVRVGTPWNAEYLRRISEPGARVAVSFGGIVGDCGGPGRHHWRLALRGASLQRLLGDGGAEGFRTRLHARQGVKCPIRPVVSAGPYCMAGNMGLDNRVLLPPFVPAGIAEDALFGSLRSSLFPACVSGFVPRAVVHDPRPRRPDPDRPVPLTLYANAVLGALAGRFCAVWPAGGGEAGLRALGAYLRALGTLPPHDFAARVRRALFTASAEAAGHFEAALARADAPPAWRAAMEANRRETAGLMDREDPSSPSDLPGDDGARRALFQRLLRDYGQVLGCWPELVAAAGELRRRGVRLAEAV